MDDSSKGRYEMIIVRDLITTMGIYLKISTNKV